MTIEEKHKKDVQFQIEGLSQDLTVMLMNNYGFDMRSAMETLYTSHTYQKIENESTGLYYQGSEYVFSFLEKELDDNKS